MSDHLVLVAPLDNRGDISPPNRLAAPMLEDRSPDDGDGMFVTFPESDASDLGEYRIYAACLLYTSPSPRDKRQSRMPSSA